MKYHLKCKSFRINYFNLKKKLVAKKVILKNQTTNKCLKFKFKLALFIRRKDILIIPAITYKSNFEMAVCKFHI